MKKKYRYQARGRIFDTNHSKRPEADQYHVFFNDFSSNSDQIVTFTLLFYRRDTYTTMIPQFFIYHIKNPSSI